MQRKTWDLRRRRRRRRRRRNFREKSKKFPWKMKKKKKRKRKKKQKGKRKKEKEKKFPKKDTRGGGCGRILDNVRLKVEVQFRRILTKFQKEMIQVKDIKIKRRKSQNDYNHDYIYNCDRNQKFDFNHDYNHDCECNQNPSKKNKKMN